MRRTEGVTSGNAADDSTDRRGWLLGHFLSGIDDQLATPDVEVKWAVYEGGESRAEWGYNLAAHTLAILVRGQFLLRFPERDILLSREGDYVLWEPGVAHDWQAQGPTVVVTVRWPSLPNDQRSEGGRGIGGTEDGGRRTEDGGRRTEDGGRRTEDGSDTNTHHPSPITQEADSR